MFPADAVRCPSFLGWAEQVLSGAGGIGPPLQALAARSGPAWPRTRQHELGRGGKAVTERFPGPGPGPPVGVSTRRLHPPSTVPPARPLGSCLILPGPRTHKAVPMPRVGLTTDRLVEAAAELADEVGFDNVSISALARRFGVKDASLYSHVRNLRELRTRLALLVGGEMIDRIAVAVVGLAGKEALVAFAGAYREYALRHPGRYAATQIRIDQEIDRELAAQSPAPRRTAEITYGMLRAYDLDEPDLTDAVRCCAAPFTGTARWRQPAASAHPGTCSVLGTRPSTPCTWPWSTGRERPTPATPVADALRHGVLRQRPFSVRPRTSAYGHPACAPPGSRRGRRAPHPSLAGTGTSRG